MRYINLGIFTILILSSRFTTAQSNAIFPQSIQQKADNMGIEFFYPIESRIKHKRNVKDNFLNYDLILKSKNRFEIRYSLIPFDDPNYKSIHPHVEITRIIASIATNDENENIRMTVLSHEEAAIKFNADWGLYADFVPKDAFSKFKIGRIVSLYKEGRGYLNCIVLYKKDNLDRFMGMPVRFTNTEQM